VWAAGSNFYGELGDGTNGWHWTPVQVIGLSDVTQIAAGFHFSAARKADGTVWTWGENDYGQLGDGSNLQRTTAVQVAGLSDVTQIATGLDHSLALKADGTVWAWGYNVYGQLGNGLNMNSNLPVWTGLTNASAVACGGDFSLALKVAGVVAWGNNEWGQLGDGTTISSLTPGWVIGLPDGAVGIAGGQFHALALMQDGSVWAWGANFGGQLGDGTTAARGTPGPVHGIGTATQIAGGRFHSMALLADGSTRLWGRNAFGQIGDGTTTDRLLPVAPAGLPPCVRLGAGPGADHSLAVEREMCTLYVPSMTGTMTEPIVLHGYLKRRSDDRWLVGKAVTFFVDGTEVGSAATDGNGRADVRWTISEGRSDRTVDARFDGDSAYHAASGSASLTATSWTTKMATFDRTARITDRTELKCRLVRSDDAPLYNKQIHFYVDGTFVITRPTDVGGYARYPYYDVPDGQGAGSRAVLCEWPGNAGYMGVSRTATLLALRALPYIWVLPKSVPQGGSANLYAYFRRLYDYQKQAAKPVLFRVDGTPVQNVLTGTGVEAGIARCLYPTTERPGTYMIRCEFAGDAWVDPGFGEAVLTIR